MRLADEINSMQQKQLSNVDVFVGLKYIDMYKN